MSKIQAFAWNWTKNGGIEGQSNVLASYDEATDWLKYQPYVNHIIIPSKLAPEFFDLIQRGEQ